MQFCPTHEFAARAAMLHRDAKEVARAGGEVEWVEQVALE